MQVVRRMSVLFLSFVLLSFWSFAQAPKQAAQADPAASPEMKRLADALAGDWKTAENMERSAFFPNGGGRHGFSHAQLGAGGTTLLVQGHSDGSAGPLSYVIAIWWDSNAKVYRFFTCFNDANDPCVLRGTAHWEGKDFVNDYEDTYDGKKAKFRDTFFEITPQSHRLVEAVDVGDGKMKPLITTMSTRR